MPFQSAVPPRQEEERTSPVTLGAWSGVGLACLYCHWLISSCKIVLNMKKRVSVNLSLYNMSARCDLRAEVTRG